MKNLILLSVMAFSFASCVNAKERVEVPKESETKTCIVLDTIIVQYPDSAQIDSLKNIVLVQKKVIDSMQVSSDTLAARLLHSRLVIENAKYYLRIANRSPSQVKFLRGWMNRALEVR